MQIRAMPLRPVFGRRPQPPRPAAPVWLADLRFFATCYAAGLLFFLVMLS